MTLNSSELDRYLARIHYSGPRSPTLPVLHALTSLHTQHIPFENLDVLLGRGIDIADDAVFDKLVVRERGGYCFEQNSLFLRVLTALGFDVLPLSARVRLDRPRSDTPARTHMFLRVLLDGVPWLTDVGVGGASLTAAIRYEVDLEQSTPHDTRRIVREADANFLQIRFGSVWHDVYEFSGEAMPLIDRVVGNWYTSTHPASHFKNRLVAARAGESGRRYTVLNNELKVRERDGRATSRPIQTPQELLAILAEHFGLHFPPDTRFGEPWLRS